MRASLYAGVSLLLKDQERSQGEWNRKARDAVNLLIRRVLGTGPSDDRPVNPTDGQIFYDRTLKKPIWWNGDDGEWKDAAGGSA